MRILHISIRKEIRDYLEIYKGDFNEFLFETEIGILNIKEIFKIYYKT